jgi:excisionase family DNA binding protein
LEISTELEGPPAPAAATAARYLTIGEVCARLGVTESTLRNWTDAGMIAAFVTPGGHRRYSEAAVADFVEGKRRALRVQDYVGLIRGGEASYRTLAQERLAGKDWYRRLDEEARLVLRDHGRRLLGLIADYLTRRSHQEETLAGGQALAADYGHFLADQGLTLGEITEAFLVFRTPLSQAAAALSHGHRPVAEQTLSAVLQTNEFIDQFLLAIIRGYEEQFGVRGTDLTPGPFPKKEGVPLSGSSSSPDASGTPPDPKGVPPSRVGTGDRGVG